MGGKLIKALRSCCIVIGNDRMPRCINPAQPYCINWKVKPTRIFQVKTEDDAPPGQGPEAAETFAQLCIDDETINLLFTKFCEIDVDNSGEIDIEEFYQFFKLQRSSFSDRCFTIMDEDGSGQVDFCEFVVCVWNYCSFDLPGLVKFAFGMFDLDGSGAIEVHELRELIIFVYGDQWQSNIRIQRIVDQIATAEDSSISFNDFQSFNKRYPALLFPAFIMQEHLRDQLYGRNWWEMISEERSSSGGMRSQSIYELLGKLNNDAFTERLAQMIDDVKNEALLKEAAEHLR